MELLSRISRHDPHRLMFAPLLGLATGFVINRARDGSIGTELLLEMLLGATVLTLIVAAVSALAAIEHERSRARALQMAALREAEARAISRHRLMLVEAEAMRCRNETGLREQLAETRNRLLALESTSNNTDLRSQLLKRAILELNQRLVSGGTQNLGEALASAAVRIEALEAQQQEMLEARGKLAALEAAQEELTRNAVALGEAARKEADEVKASLKLAISDSQRQRNIAGQDREESGRIIELEARIKRLAREIEKLSGRDSVVSPEGVASNVAQGGTQDQAKLGFFKALLDANQTLRKQIRAAA